MFIPKIPSSYQGKFLVIWWFLIRVFPKSSKGNILIFPKLVFFWILYFSRIAFFTSVFSIATLRVISFPLVILPVVIFPMTTFAMAMTTVLLMIVTIRVMVVISLFFWMPVPVNLRLRLCQKASVQLLILLDQKGYLSFRSCNMHYIPYSLRNWWLPLIGLNCQFFSVSLTSRPCVHYCKF